MSKRIAVVSEGPTDVIVMRAVVASLMQGTDFIMNPLYPEYSEALRNYQGEHGTGWQGVLGWCEANKRDFGSVEYCPALLSHDVLIIHLDADVADEDEIGVAQPCPPADATTNQLRQLLLARCGILDHPRDVVFCVPSKATEAWVLAALYPQERIRGDLECLPNPAGRLQAKPAEQRLVAGGKKIKRKFEERSDDIKERWSVVRGRCSEARRFSDDLLRIL